MSKFRFLVIPLLIFIFMFGFVNNVQAQPPIPASFYGLIQFSDDAPGVGGVVDAYILNVKYASTTIINNSGFLVYGINVPGDIPETGEKEGGVNHDEITFKIGDRIVAKADWMGGTNTSLNLHPPQAVPGGPYSGNVGAEISFSASSVDTGNDVVKYEWDWEDDGTYDATGQSVNHAFDSIGVKTVGLKVTDDQDGEGKATVQVTLNPIPVTVMADSGQTKVFGEADPIFTYTSDTAVSFSGSLSRDPGTDVGSYAITIGSLSAGANYTINFVPANFTITPKSITVTADSGQTKVFGEADPTYTYTSDTAVSFSGSLSRDPGTDVGSYAITIGSLSAGVNHTISFVPANFTITPKSITVTANTGQSKVFGTADPTFTYTSDPVITFSGNLSRDPGEAVGSYAITIGSLSAGANYTITFVSANFTITPAATHNIALYAGWNLVSFTLHPTNTAIANVLSSVDGNFDIVYAWDATGAHSGSGNWLKYDNVPQTTDSLTNLDETKGFWIHVLSDDTLDISGTTPATTAIPMYDNTAGWNLVGYPSITNGAIPGVLDATDSMVYAYHANDAADHWKLYDRNGAPYANDLSQLTPGWGYWIKTTSDHTWNVGY